MKENLLKVAAVALAGAVLAGCVTAGAGAGGMSQTPTIPSYSALTVQVDTSARLAVYGINAAQRNALCTMLRSAGHPIAGKGFAGGKVLPPDFIVEIVSVGNSLSVGGGKMWVTTELTVRVRKPMRAEPGQAPVANEGEVFKAWAQGPTEGEPSYLYALNGQGVAGYRYPAAEVKLFGQACRNLMTLEPFRRALERK